ncbi:dipeptidase [uncultured Sphingomonas sp.]|uniref:dipeptidase n=1 Tax=uncultured Sphingomonas sp. TaxID=158754 RepID=UPI0035CAF444
MATRDRAAALLRYAVVWDNHACMPLRPGDTAFLDRLDDVRRAGVTAVTLNVAMDPIPWAQTFKMLATMRSWIAARPDKYVLGDSAASIRAAKRDGRLAVLFDIEGGAAVDDLPDLVEVYYALGVRWMLIAYDRYNRLGAGCRVSDTGLTAFGRAVIDAMEQVGMLLCCSHTGERTAAEAIEYCRNPVIFSHSNPAALRAHRRNIPDALIRACAAKGGVIGLVGFGPFVSDERPVPLERLADMADHIAALVGPAHVGLGLDQVFDVNEGAQLARDYPEWFGGFASPADFPPMLTSSAIPELVDILLTRGWRDDDVEGLLGANLLRVADQVWK